MFWQSEFWAAGFWADGFWAGEAAVLPAPRGPTVFVRAGFSELAYRQHTETYCIGYKEDTVFKAMPAQLGSVPRTPIVTAQTRVPRTPIVTAQTSVPRTPTVTAQTSGDYQRVRIQYSPDKTVADSPTSAETVQLREHTDRSRHGQS